MAESLRVGVVGAGCVGCYVGGKLLAADAADVVLVGRPRLGDLLAARGLIVKDFDKPAVTVPAARVAFATEIAALAGCDVVLCCVKSAQTEEVAGQLAAVLRPDALVASLQNGVGNAAVLRAHLGARPVLAGIVSFNVVERDDGTFHRATGGPLMLERAASPTARALARALDATGIGYEERLDLAPDQWTKLLINLNNAVSALSGAPTRTLILSPAYRRILAALIGEGLAVLRRAGIKPAPLRGIPIRLLPHVLRMPTLIVRAVSRAQLQIDPEARSSMWQDLSRGRATEVDYLNGELVRLAERGGTDAPLNRRIVALVHEAEARGAGSPGLAADVLWSRLRA